MAVPAVPRVALAVPTNSARPSSAPSPGVPVRVRHTSHGARSDAAFTVVEVLIAVMIIALVVAGGARAAVAARHNATKSDVRATTNAIAQQALEQIRTDLGFQRDCSTTLWRNDTAPAYRWCTDQALRLAGRPYGDFVLRADQDGRRYRVVRAVQPVDDPADGQGSSTAAATGTGDADQRPHDWYRATVTVTPDPASMANLGVGAPERFATTVSGRVSLSLQEAGSVAIQICAHYRRERSLDTATCSAATAPVPGVRVTLTGMTTGTGGPYSAKSDTTGMVVLERMVKPGHYRVGVQSPVNGHTFYRAAPRVLHVPAYGWARGAVTMVKPTGRTQICYRFDRPDEGLGWVVDATNVNWSERHSPVFRSTRLTKIGYPRWKCLRYQNGNRNFLDDPLGYQRDRMYQARYPVQIEQVYQNLKVVRVVRDCTTNPSPLRRVTSWGGYPPAGNGTVSMPYNINYRQLPGTHRICITFRGNPVKPELKIGKCPSDDLEFRWRPYGYYFQNGGENRGWPFSGPRSGEMSFYGNTKYSYDPDVGAGTCNFTASGERYDPYLLTASALTHSYRSPYGGPMNCVLVRWGDKELVVKVNDTGSHVGRIMDISAGGAHAFTGSTKLNVTWPNPQVSLTFVGKTGFNEPCDGQELYLKGAGDGDDDVDAENPKPNKTNFGTGPSGG